MKNILVATDGSVLSGKALARAIELAAAPGAKLTIVNVMDVQPMGEAVRRFAVNELAPATTAALLPPLRPLPGTAGYTDLDAVDQIDDQSRAVAQLVSERILQDARATAMSAGIADVETISAAGDPGREIARTAKSIGADVVVIGRRGLSGLNEMLLGSASQKVLHHAHTNVLICS